MLVPEQAGCDSCKTLPEADCWRKLILGAGRSKEAFLKLLAKS